MTPGAADRSGDFDSNYFRELSTYSKFADENSACILLTRWYTGLFRLLHRHAGLRQMREPVLDVGCGHGAVLELLGRRGTSVIGSDLSSFILDAARRATGRPPLVCANATFLPFTTDSIGTVLTLEVVEHVPEAQAAVGEIARVITPGGLVVVTTPNPAADVLPIYDSHHDSTHVSVKPRIEWERILVAAGLELVESSTILNMPVVWRLGGWASHAARVPRLGPTTLLVARK